MPATDRDAPVLKRGDLGRILRAGAIEGEGNASEGGEERRKDGAAVAGFQPGGGGTMSKNLATAKIPFPKAGRSRTIRLSARPIRRRGRFKV